MTNKITVPKLAVPSIIKKFNNGHWQFSTQMGGKESVGFIYVIRDNFLKRFYLGKKQYRGTGKLNKGKESDWKKYKSSSKLLLEMFKERPSEEFDFICIEEYKAKGALAYGETWSLCLVEAPTTTGWYNTRIEAISWSVKEGITDNHKERLNKTINWTKFNE
jgi:hypothetical protein